MYRWGICVFLLVLAPCADSQPEVLSLTADEAVETALARNAEMSIRAAELAVAEAEAKSAGSPPPLRLSLSPTTIWEQFTAAISSVLDISGRRKWASRAARHELAATVAGNEEFRLELTAATRSAYWHLCIAQQRVEVAVRNVDLAEEVERSVARLAEEGVGLGISVTRAQNELSATRLEQRRADADLRSTQMELAKLLHIAPETQIVAEEPVPAQPLSVPEATLLQVVALEKRPAMQRVGTLARAAMARARVEGAESKPDLEVGVEREEGVNFGRALLELPLIDFGTIKHGKRAAKARAEAALTEVDVLETEIRQEVQSAVEAFLTASEAERRLSEDLLPRQTRIVEVMQRGYSQRATTYLDLLQEQSKLEDLRSRLLDAVAERTDAFVRIERAIGTPLEGIQNADNDT